MPSYRYPGPRPFEENDISLFFGREKDKKNLLTFINVEPLLVLFSKSGLGKSSLVNAAIIPELRKKDYEIIVCRFNSYVNKDIGENINAEQQSPLQKLFSEVKGRLNTSATFLDTIIKNPEPLSLWHQFKNLQISDSDKKIYFIFFDQFEELFTYPSELVKEFKEHLAELLGVSIPQEYLTQINALENDAASPNLTDEQLGLLYDPIPVKMLCTIRSDKFSLLTNLKDAIPGIVTKTYELKPFNTREATDAIIKPASIENGLTGVDFISNSFTYNDEAIKKMLNYLSDDGTEDIESFQLQVLCRYVEDMVIENKKENNELKNITASQLGEIKNIFEAYYNRLIEGIDKDKVNNVKKLFEEGLIFEKDKIRVPLYKGQITDTYGVDEVLLNKLVNTHLMRSELDTNGKERYELSHDSLIEPILKAKEKRLAEEKEQENLQKQKEEQEKQLQENEAEKNKLQTQLQMQRLKSRNRIFSMSIFFILIIFIILFYVLKQNEKYNVLSIQFRNDERDWFYSLDARQQNLVLTKSFLFLKDKNPNKYNKTKYSYKCVAYANQNSKTNALFALQFIQEGYLKDSANEVIQESFKSFINKPNISLPSLKISCYGIINNIKPTKDQQTIIAATSEGVFWYDIKNGNVINSLTNPVYKSDYSVFSDDGKYLLYGLYDNTTFLLNLSTKERSAIKTPDYQQYYAAFSIAHNNAFIVYASIDTLNVVSLNGGLLKKYVLPTLNNNDISTINISSDNKYLAAGTENGDVFLIDLESAKNKIIPLKAATKSLHAETVNSISFSQDNKFILSGSSDGQIQIWDIKNNRISQTINESFGITTCRFSNDNKHIVIGETKSGRISYWNSEKNSSSIALNNSNNLDVYSENLRFNKDSVQLIGLDSNITSVNFYNNGSGIIASSNNQVSIWNLSNDKKPPLKINEIAAMHFIPRLTMNNQIKWKLVAPEDLLALTHPRQIFESIVILNDSLKDLNAKPNGIKENRQTFIKLTNIIPQLFDHLKNAKENINDRAGKLDKLDTFDIYIFTGNAYFYKILLNQDSLNGNFSKYNFEKMISFRQAPFKLDTMYKKCFDDLFSAYSIAISYYFKNNQYSNALYWNNKIIKDNPQLESIKEIQNDLMIINQYNVSFHILKSDFDKAKQLLKDWPQKEDNLSYVLTKELVDICTKPGYTFNESSFKKQLELFDLEEGHNIQSISDMDAVAFRLTEEGNTKQIAPTVVDNLVMFDNYIYSLIK